MYNPTSLDSERMSWRVVVYFNVICSIKKILATLEALDDMDDGTDSQSTLERQELGNDEVSIHGTSSALFQVQGMSSSPEATSPTTIPSPTLSNPMKALSISELRLRLLPLTKVELQLADQLSGGVVVSGSGKGAVYVRTGWQARSSHKSHKSSGRRLKNAESVTLEPKKSEHPELAVDRPGTAFSMHDTDALIEEVAHMLSQSFDNVTKLWEHPVVRGLISKRKLKLDEWSEL